MIRRRDEVGVVEERGAGEHVDRLSLIALHVENVLRVGGEARRERETYHHHTELAHRIPPEVRFTCHVAA